ncbi:prenyltransferase/squalene oxidase repeat-containing protein [Mariniblastus fucicola]|uniref:Prenyltransferase and squalene oxidase repeat protein n=1 Tax=Mariniblastus fucicola TaxID=980251 RepID=A0A5B9PEA7_9BACT|nr:terpene cyclase/mutase family protein [Mariniblastus fucicola]QEG21361.1 hypothetical protein MFFC18_12170 [Mariniblastus fucicola]
MKFSRRRFIASGMPLMAVPTLGLFQAKAWSSVSDREDEKAPVQLELTSKSIESVRRGLEWLKRTEGRRGGHGADVSQPDDIGCSAMVGLALLADGSTPSQGPNKTHLRRIVNYLIGCVEAMPNGNITSKSGTQLQNKIGSQAHTFFALLFLSQVCGEIGIHKKTREAVAKLVETVVKAQSPRGDWGQESWAPTLGTVMGWTSLRSAHFAGFRVGGSPEKTADHLMQQMKGSLGQKQQHWMHSLYKNATGIRVLCAMGKEEEAISKRAFADVLELVTRDNTAFNQAGGEEFLAFHLITETMLQKEGNDWATWFPKVRDKMLDVQNDDGCWTGHHCITSRTFCTAAACLVLSAPNRYLPISQK